MSKKKKKNKRSNKPAPKPGPEQVLESPDDVRLSQCMIVKNEEKHIKRALEWAKPIAFEQIVVDTGSTDKTVEIAENLGAKVYHFKWIDDFSAAKNYAIGQATGNWIAFLDADEYMSPEDAIKLMETLKKIKQHPDPGKNITTIRTPMVNIDDDGNATDVFSHCRVYRNIEEIRYMGTIHERIAAFGEVLVADDISIIHTGYSEAEHKEKKKTDRNITMLRKELENNPDDIVSKAYLADTIRSKLILDHEPEKKDEDEVYALFKEVIESNEQIPDFLVKKAYLYHIGKVWKKPEKEEECEKLCEAGYNKFPDDLDLGYYYAVLLNKKNGFSKAWKILKRLESTLTAGEGHIMGASARVQSEPIMIFGQLLMAAQGLGDIDNTITYATYLLMSDKNQQEILMPYIHALIKSGIPENEVFELLSKIYNITSPNDLLFIAKAAKEAGAIELARLVLVLAKEKMG